ncbi:demethylspheroidene O-methyltransferase [Roseiarcus fermentans]|uniref:Demethylspheroidene O-methyltransferase n=1 Tax=Roseiarcus fermentans TaxID=1473586 RepID=A0A366EMF9_9HYPH|nr:methyltransferase [Roseiarcus fermentans]RBP02900.1 demethylspheroidene O-methyltransferase [Roseiarcus fermentans]
MASPGLPPLFSALARRIKDWRIRRTADPAFQRWAAQSPLTRGLVRRDARALFDLCAGFVYSQILSACVKLRVFEILRAGAVDVATTAAETGLEPPAALRLLKAAAALRLVRALPDGRFALDDLGAATLGNAAVAEFVAHHDLFYADLADPAALLRGHVETRLSRFWSYASDPTRPDDGDGAAAAYSALMSRTHAQVADAVLAAYPFVSRRRLLDVGGGEGAFAVAAAQRHPRLAVTLFDLPRVAERARARLTELGLQKRVAVAGGDMLRDPLPEGADVATLVRVLHDHNDAEAGAILAAVRGALPHDGDILIAEPMSGIRGAEPMGDAYFGLYLLAMGRGRPRTPDEIGALLKDAGFARPLRLRTPNPFVLSIVKASRV